MKTIFFLLIFDFIFVLFILQKEDTKATINYLISKNKYENI